MTAVTVALWIVASLWVVVSACVLVMVCDLERERRRKHAPPPPPPLPVPPLRLPAGGVYLHMDGVTFYNDLPVDTWITQPVWVRDPVRWPAPLPQAEREQMVRMQNEMVRQAMQAFTGSQSLGYADRCDICGARIIQRHHDMTVLFYNPEKDSRRCQGLCGWQKSEAQREGDRLESRNEGQLSLPPRFPPPLSSV